MSCAHFTSAVLSACNIPASGPESNSTEILTGPAGCDWGTRTEAWQNVPQAKPECAVASVWSSAVVKAILAPKVSWSAGETGAPR